MSDDNETYIDIDIPRAVRLCRLELKEARELNTKSLRNVGLSSIFMLVGVAFFIAGVLL